LPSSRSARISSSGRMIIFRQMRLSAADMAHTARLSRRAFMVRQHHGRRKLSKAADSLTGHASGVGVLVPT
jgi:hypothetical protein